MLSDGRTRVSVLSVKPANVGAPTVAELTAGIYASPWIPKSVWKWSAGDPNTVNDTDLEKAFDVEVPTTDTYDLGFGAYRDFLPGGGFDSTGDALFQLVKVKGTTIYVYARKTDKLSTTAWATGDEIYLGGAVVTGTPKASPDGYIKYEVPLYPSDLRSFIAAA
jgi:hypothetical protein